MTWCDKLASQPTFGFAIDAHHVPASTVLERISATIDSWAIESKTLPVNIADPFKLEVQHDNGFTYTFEPARLSVQFNHRVRINGVSAGLPQAEVISSDRVFTQLLGDEIATLIALAQDLPNSGKRKVSRIGILTTTVVARDDAPPGIQAFLEYMDKPWVGKIERTNINVVARVNDNDDYFDRCIHTIETSEDDSSLLVLRFDWQRLFNEGKKVPLERRNLERACENARDAALSYFEELAVGERFGEIVNG
jgi:hypothetical protein